MSRNTINYEIWSRNVLFSLHPDVLLHLGTLYYEGKWGEKIEKKDRLTESYLIKYLELDDKSPFDSYVCTVIFPSCYHL